MATSRRRCFPTVHVWRVAAARDSARRPAARAGDDAGAGAGSVVNRPMNANAQVPPAATYRMTLGKLLEGFDVATPHGVQVTGRHAGQPRGHARLRVPGVPGPHDARLDARRMRPSSAARRSYSGNRLQASSRPCCLTASLRWPFRTSHDMRARLRIDFSAGLRPTCALPASPAPTARPRLRTCSRRLPNSSAGAAGISARLATAGPTRWPAPGSRRRMRSRCNACLPKHATPARQRSGSRFHRTPWTRTA